MTVSVAARVETTFFKVEYTCPVGIRRRHILALTLALALHRADTLLMVGYKEIDVRDLNGMSIYSIGY